jgi:ribosomal protein L3 glutamine methyltransferase
MAMEELPPEYGHEPQLALAGGDDGLDAVRTILARAAEFLKPDGLLVVEVGQNRAGAEAAFPRLPFTWLSTKSSDEAVFLLNRDELLTATRAVA